jgi:hypothetical protein
VGLGITTLLFLAVVGDVVVVVFVVVEAVVVVVFLCEENFKTLLSTRGSTVVVAAELFVFFSWPLSKGVSFLFSLLELVLCEVEVVEVAEDPEVLFELCELSVLLVVLDLSELDLAELDLLSLALFVERGLGDLVLLREVVEVVVVVVAVVVVVVEVVEVAVLTK